MQVVAVFVAGVLLSVGATAGAAQNANPALTGIPRIDARRAPAAPPTPAVSDANAPASPPPASGEDKRQLDRASDAVTQCIQLWDKATHMTRTEWAATCRRIQGRVDNAKADLMVPKAVPKRP
jgi:hypothetical protein